MASDAAKNIIDGHRSKNNGTDIPTSTRPFGTFKQAWRDYKNGRKMRKANEQQGRSAQDIDNAGSGKTGWKAQGGEYPWRIEKTVQGNTKWRGTWIVEVKNFYDISWKHHKFYDGKKWKWACLPQGQCPFPLCESKGREH